ncbi:hypothetical protein AAG570_000430 [Ranatra chinensis]|uniref:Tyrosine specific protein phosphatases domain-containing protein n=1 Tax=Ranatra chinensis TaxID=642074 RepID=A0ABD0ZI81_9HEMI
MGCLKSVENVKYVLDQGIVHLVSLSPEKQPPFEHFPNYFRWTPIDVLEFEPPTLEQMITFIKICEESRKLKEAIGVHCRMGRGRSGVMAACYLVRFKGMHPDKAIMRIRLMTKGAIETYFQERAVWEYWDHLKRTRSPSPDVETLIANMEVRPYQSVLHKYYPELAPNQFIKEPEKYLFGSKAQPFEY